MVINDELADVFERQFDLLARAGDQVTDELLAANNAPTRGISLGSATLECWFTRLSRQKDIEEIVSLVEGARDGVLFVMFQPGNEPVQTLLEMQAQNKLYVRGVATRFTSRGLEQFKLLKKKPEEFFLDSAQASGVGMTVAEWAVEGTASDFRAHIGHAITHSKVIVIDPFGDDPIVITGSHNFSKSASEGNDENFIVIRGHPAVAMHYAVNAIQTYNHYRWRAYLAEAAHENRDPFRHLSRDPAWQHRRRYGETKRMLSFWLGNA
jgi:phosphatidylserine/phosphatidylglycerophosphate/cardiolipin synthase-like enzyme